MEIGLLLILTVLVLGLVAIDYRLKQILVALEERKGGGKPE